MAKITPTWSDIVARETIKSVPCTTDFYNLKNKADGARRIGYVFSVAKITLMDDTVIFRGRYQTTLDGQRYQSSKDTYYFTTESEVMDSLNKTIDGAMKRYAKLALDPKNKISVRA
jgi:hypothetical protein